MSRRRQSYFAKKALDEDCPTILREIALVAATRSPTRRQFAKLVGTTEKNVKGRFEPVSLRPQPRKRRGATTKDNPFQLSSATQSRRGKPHDTTIDHYCSLLGMPTGHQRLAQFGLTSDLRREALRLLQLEVERDLADGTWKRLDQFLQSCDKAKAGALLHEYLLAQYRRRYAPTAFVHFPAEDTLNPWWRKRPALFSLATKLETLGFNLFETAKLPEAASTELYQFAMFLLSTGIGSAGLDRIIAKVRSELLKIGQRSVFDAHLAYFKSNPFARFTLRLPANVRKGERV